MTDNELNEMVAEKVMGFVKLRYVYPSPYPNNDGILLGTVDGQEKPIPDYCNDIAAAWQVVEKLRGMGAWLSFGITENATTWDFRGVIEERGKRENRFIAHHASPSCAICLAALKAVGVSYV